VLKEPNKLSPDEVEAIEKQSLRSLFLAAKDFAFDAFDIFEQSSDDQKDIAEDITREMLERLGGYRVEKRILGNVDYRKARYVVLPEYATRQALFVDSKAEKTSSSATLQMSQLSLGVYQLRSGVEMAEKGAIQPVSIHGGLEFISTTLLAHYYYEQPSPSKPNRLSQLTLAAIPNGRLQKKYNPSSKDSIWIVGRNAPTRGEDFRVRLSFNRLSAKAAWRIQRLTYDPVKRSVRGEWSEGDAD